MDHVRQVELACKAGVKWIQLRMKLADDLVFAETVRKALDVCAVYGARLMVNDRAGCGRLDGVHGVHVGLQDMPVAAVRGLLGTDRMVGGTANCHADIVRHAEQGADYVGLGPYRWTATKKNLSPILGLDGYQRILRQMRADGIDLPVIAIGGIFREDIPALFEAGVSGVAFSGMLLHAEDRMGLIRGLREKISMNTKNLRPC